MKTLVLYTVSRLALIFNSVATEAGPKNKSRDIGNDMIRDTSNTLLSMQVNNNGLLSFLRGVSLFTPEPFPLSGNQRVIAPYWADVDTRGTGTVWFRITTNSSLLARARDEIAAFVNQEDFSPAYLFIATWDHVGYYNRRTDRVGCLFIA